MKNKTNYVRFKLKYAIIALLVLSINALISQVWVPQNSGTGSRLNSVWFRSQQIGFIGGINEATLFTVNGGLNWTSRTVANQDFNSVAFKTPLLGLMAGTNGTISRTTDGGLVWNSVNSGTGENLNTVSFGDSGIVYSAGTNGIILKSTDNGLHFASLDSTKNLGSTTLKSSSVKGSSFAIFVGDAGKIIVTTNAGMTFQLQNSGTTRDLRSVFFLNNSTGYIAGKANILLFTSNGGINWVSRNSGMNVDSSDDGLHSVFFLNTLNGFAVGAHGMIFRTTNAGLNWISETSQTTKDLLSVYFVDENHGWTVGKEGTIRFRGSLTGVNNNQEIANIYNLEQNYPNPFNPTTRIRFELPASDFVTLKIYDIIGNEVSTLVNSNLASGHYDYQFDASNLSSGIYFYSLKTSHFIETKKMTLVK